MWYINRPGADEVWGLREEGLACDVGGSGTSRNGKERTGQRATDVLSCSDPNNQEVGRSYWVNVQPLTCT